MQPQRARYKEQDFATDLGEVYPGVFAPEAEVPVHYEPSGTYLRYLECEQEEQTTASRPTDLPGWVPKLLQIAGMSALVVCGFVVVVSFTIQVVSASLESAAPGLEVVSVYSGEIIALLLLLAIAACSVLAYKFRPVRRKSFPQKPKTTTTTHRAAGGIHVNIQNNVYR